MAVGGRERRGQEREKKTEREETDKGEEEEGGEGEGEMSDDWSVNRVHLMGGDSNQSRHKRRSGLTQQFST